MDEAYKIVPVTPELMDGVESIERACFAVPWSRRGLEDDAFSDCGHWYAAIDGEGSPRAFIGCRVIADEADIVNLAVSPACRRKGLARALIQRFFADFPAVEATYLEVRRSNTGAQALYRSLGFERYSVRKNYYEKPAEDAILMWRRPRRR